MFCQVFVLGILGLLSTVAARDLPILNLPWGKWQATELEHDPNILVFRNVRFGAKPERFGRAFAPSWKNDTIQEVDGKISCLQIVPKNSVPNTSLIQQEDCLFLDVYIPRRAVEDNSEPLPVVVWIYGGAYAIGAKDVADPFYTGESFIRSSGYQVIYVVGNYRLNALGFLSGNYMEQKGQPNAGLYDQSLLLEWVQDHIHKVGGNKNEVRIYGESAGGGSILHHLIREDGAVKPNFTSFVSQSPAYQWAWDNSPNGRLDDLFKTFSDLAGCGHKFNIECLRELDDDEIPAVNQKFYDLVTKDDIFPVGPSVDGKWIKSIPTISFSQGNYWKEIDSAIILHVSNEGAVFKPTNVTDDSSLDYYLEQWLPGPGLQPQRDLIRGQYNCTRDFQGDYGACSTAIVADSIFLCHTRDLFDSYPHQSYVMEYGYPHDNLAIHGSDIMAQFANSYEQLKNMLTRAKFPPEVISNYSEPLWFQAAGPFQKYLGSFAATKDPNTLRLGSMPEWPKANGDGDKLSQVMKVNYDSNDANVFHLQDDSKNSNSTCHFWRQLALTVV